MDTLAHWLATYSESGIMFLLRWSWQALLLLTIAWLLLTIPWLLLKCYRRQTPTMRHQIWLYALVAVAILPLWTVLVRWFPLAPSTSKAIAYVAEMPAAVIASGPKSVTQAVNVLMRQNAPAASFLIWPCLLLAWAVGALITLARMARSDLRLRWARTRAQPVLLSALGCDGLDLALLNVTKVHVRLSSAVRSPMLIGVLHPMILLPADIAEWTTAPERLAMLQHELAHLQRRDHYVNCLQIWFRVVFFFHPLVRYACHQLHLERELACDGRVLSMGTAAAVYAESILKVAEHNSMQIEAYQPAFLASKQNLKRRIEMIMNQQCPPLRIKRWPWLAPPLVLMSMMIWLLVPVSGQKAVRSSLGGRPSSAQEEVDLPVPPPPLTIPLPEEVTGLHRVVFFERDQSQVFLTVEGQAALAKGDLKDVTVSIPGVTFKADKARGRPSTFSVSIRFHRGGPSHDLRAMPGAPLWGVSIRFHRGGPSHFDIGSSRSPSVKVSIRFHRGGPSHLIEYPMETGRISFNPLSSRWSVSPYYNSKEGKEHRVSIRFHRGGPSHTTEPAYNMRECFNPLSSRWSVSPVSI